MMGRSRRGEGASIDFGPHARRPKDSIGTHLMANRTLCTLGLPSIGRRPLRWGKGEGRRNVKVLVVGIQPHICSPPSSNKRQRRAERNDDAEVLSFPVFGCCGSHVHRSERASHANTPGQIRSPRTRPPNLGWRRRRRRSLVRALWVRQPLGATCGRLETV